MLSVILPTLNAEKGLPHTLRALRPGQTSGLVGEVIIVDGGSTDATPTIATENNYTLLSSPAGRARQMHHGALHAKGDWLLFLHADVILQEGWEVETQNFLNQHGTAAKIAAVFRFALRDASWRARLIERGVFWRCKWLALPYGDQGLLIPSAFYRNLGGFALLPLMEDVEIMRRITGKRLVLLRSEARSDAARYQSDGFLSRSCRNILLTTFYLLGVPAQRLASFYTGRKRR